MHSIASKDSINEMVMKTCPKCNQSWPEDYECCPACGADLPATDNRPSASVGDNNTFTGGVHSTDNRTTTNSNNVTQTNSNNTTNNTTVYEAPKSSSQLLNENIASYRLECKKLYKNGLISKEGEERLRELQAALGLADELVLPIKEEIQQKSKKPMAQLSVGVLNGIRKTKTVIEQNSSAELNRQLQQLDSWMKEYEDDALKSYYFQLSSMLEPTRYTERYEQSAKDEYWEVYWAYIAYLLQNKEKQAFDAQASLGRLQDDHPEQNEILLTLAGRLLQNAREDSTDRLNQEYNTRTIHCSQELKLLLDSIDELLHKDWTSEPPIVICDVHSFYVDTLFKSFVETQRENGMNRRIEIERLNRIEREKQIELQRQKDLLLGQFQEKKDIDQACNILGIPYLTVKEWKNEDSTFYSKYNEIVRRIEAERSEEAERIRRAQELEEKIRQKKAQFKFKYQQNGCDFIKTCSDLGVDSDTVRMWKASDKAFDDGLTIIEREHEKQLQELFVQFYESNGCDLQKACAAAGVSAERVNGWRKSNKEFDGVLTAIYNEHVQEIKDALIKCYHDNECDLLKTCSEIGIDSYVYRDWLNSDRAFADRIKYTEDKINKQHREEDDRLISAQKEQFIAAYELNNCDMQKTCSDLGLSHHDIKKWRESDKVFDNKVSSIKKTHDKKLWKFVLSKVIPVILVIALLAFIVCRIGNIIKTKQQEELKTELVINTHKDLLSSFDIAISKVKLDDNGADALEKVASILFEIKSYEDIHKDDLTEPKYAVLRQRVLNLCDDLFAYYRGKATPLTDNPSLNEQDVIKYGGLRDRVKVLKSKI